MTHRHHPASPALTALLALGLIFSGAPTLQAQQVCRPNALGRVTCTGSPATGIQPRPLFRDGAEGLGAVQEPPGLAEPSPRLVPRRRGNTLGSTVLDAQGGRPEPRARRCTTDALGNLACR